jgi:hypothetical protein
MKAKFLSFLALSTVAFSLIIACNKENTIPTKSLNHKIKELHEQYSIQSSDSSSLNKLDNGRVKHLASADALGLVGFSSLFSTPVVGPFVTLWGAFGTSYFACSWCPILRNGQAINNSGSGSELQAAITRNEELVVNGNINPFNSIGQMHNKLMIEVAFNDEKLFTSDNKLSEFSKNYINNQYTSITEAEKQALTSMIEGEIPYLIGVVSHGDDNKLLTFLERNTEVSSLTKASITNTVNFVFSNELEENQVLNYLLDLEKIVAAETSISEGDKAVFLQYLAVFKYSYVFWDTLKDF